MIERDDLDVENPGIQQEKLEAAFDLLKQIEAVDKRHGYDRVVRPLRLREKRLRVWRWVAACAAIVCPLIVGEIWLTEKSIDDIPLVKTDSIVPGMSKARLVLGNKKEVLLDTLSTRDLLVDAGITIRKEGKGVIYESRQQAGEKDPVYNELIVPRGGEYDVILEDGTHVWLNADSKLKYPAVFTGKQRRVYLEGEGYFDVAKDSIRPFLVETREQNIQVLGTAFNVYAYFGEQMNYTTLVRGKVSVRDKRGGKQWILHPGQQVCMDVTNEECVVREVDVRKEIAWKDGLFVFHGQTLEQIMTKLARWYDITVFFQSEEAKSLLFKGNLPRYSDFQIMLNVLEKSSNVQFNVKDRVVTVSI